MQYTQIFSAVKIENFVVKIYVNIAHLKPDLGAFSHHDMTLNTNTPLLTS